MPFALNVEGIKLAKGPVDLNRSRGRLDLPPEFPQGRYACQWVKKGVNVDRARQHEHVTIEGTVYVADGWEVWLNPATKKPHTRTLASGVYVLLVRPIKLQQTLQRISANVSRNAIRGEIQGETIAGDVNSDSGMLTDDILAKVPGLGREGDVARVLPPINPLTDDTTGAHSGTVKTETRKPTKSINLKRK